MFTATYRVQKNKPDSTGTAAQGMPVGAQSACAGRVARGPSARRRLRSREQPGRISCRDPLHTMESGEGADGAIRRRAYTPSAKAPGREYSVVVFTSSDVCDGSAAGEVRVSVSPMSCLPVLPPCSISKHQLSQATHEPSSLCACVWGGGSQPAGGPSPMGLRLLQRRRTNSYLLNRTNEP